MGYVFLCSVKFKIHEQMKKRQVIINSSLKKKRKYVAPLITVESIEMEQGIAVSSISTVSIGGPCNGQPEIADQLTDEKTFEIEF